MVNLSERQTRWAFAGFGIVCFVLLLTLEIATEGDEISAVDLAVDALSILLTAAHANSA